MTRLALIRHGATAWNAEGRLQGRADIPLSPQGRAELAGLAPHPALEGAVWLASPMTGEVLRVREGGTILARIPAPNDAVACMLGGEDGKTLFMLTAATSDSEKAAASRTGKILVAEVDAPRAGRP